MFIKYSEAKIVDSDLSLEKVSEFIDQKEKLTKNSEKDKKTVKTEK